MRGFIQGKLWLQGGEALPSLLLSKVTFGRVIKGERLYGYSEYSILRSNVTMTAIGGIMTLDGSNPDRDILERMGRVLSVYGNDSVDVFVGRATGMVRCLLRIEQEDRFDRQPLMSEDGRYLGLFDGRLYNRNELLARYDLDIENRSQTADSTLAFLLLAKFGISCLSDFRGDFACVVVDQKEQRLILVRDFLGIRPLFWARGENCIAFSSMPKGLFVVPGIQRAVCDEALTDYMCLLPMEAETSFFQNIFRVPPASYLEFEGSRKKQTRYHSFRRRQEAWVISEDETMERFCEVLQTAVNRRIGGTGNIAAHLSSGLDSSTVVALAATELRKTNRRLVAITSSPDSDRKLKLPKRYHGDESVGARAVAELFDNVDHKIIGSHLADGLSSLSEYVELLDRSPLNPCNVGWALASQKLAVSAGARVLLTGTRGNYSISYHGIPRLPRLLGRGKLLELWGEFKAIKRRNHRVTARSLLAYCLSAYLPSFFWSYVRKRRGLKKRSLNEYSPIRSELLSEREIAARAKSKGFDLSYRPSADGWKGRVEALRRFDSGEFAAAANADGIELRHPLADQDLIEFCLQLPESYFFRDGLQAWILRCSMRNLLPSEVLDSPTLGLQAADWYLELAEVRESLQVELESLRGNSRVQNFLDSDCLQDALGNWEQDLQGIDFEEFEVKYRLRMLRGLSVASFVRYTEPGNS